MKKISKHLLLLSIVLSSTQLITTPFMDFSIFQIVMIIALVFCFVGLIKIKTIKLNIYICFSFIAFLSSFIAWKASIYPSWAKSYFLLGALTALLCFFIPIYFEREDVSLLLRALIRSQYITIPLSIYSAFCFYVKGGIPNKINLGFGCFIELEQDLLIRAQASGHIRLTLPYATPPVLSVVMSLCIIVLLFDSKLFCKVVRLTLITSFSIILILTGSRTGMVSIGIFLGIWVLRYLSKNKLISRKLVLIFLVLILLILVFLIRGSNIEYLQKYIYRFTVMFDPTYLMDSGHITIPIDGLLIWVSSLKNFFVGIGFGSSYYIEGAHIQTLPPYFLNSYVTWIVERGILGAVLIILLFILLGKCRKKCSNQHDYACLYALIVSLLSALFYETFNCYFVIFVIAINFVRLNTRKSGEFNNGCNINYYSNI